MNFKDYSDEELKEIYDIHKDMYYNGTVDEDIEPISDDEFNELEQHLVDNVPGFEKYVGTKNEPTYGRHNKVKHWYPMLSLAKEHAGETILDANVDRILKHVGELSDLTEYGMSWKLDGFGISLKYRNRKLCGMVTRGDKLQGVDIIQKFGSLVPQEIDFHDDLEVRAEMVMTKENFKKYESEYSHPRNLVVGIKNNEDLNDPRLADIDVVCVEAITPDGNTIDSSDLYDLNRTFNTVEKFYAQNKADIYQIYQAMLYDRQNYDYPTDGIVLSVNHKSVLLNPIRKHNGHDPSDAIAIKFPAPTFTTTVTKVEWNLKRSGNLIPRVFFEPVKVDGRDITKCSGFNAKFITENRIGTGAEIVISLSGDIIPTLRNVTRPSDSINIPMEGNYMKGVHLVQGQTFRDAPGGQELEGFVFAMEHLGLDKFGPSTFRDIYRNCLYNGIIEKNRFVEIFNRNKINVKTIEFLGPKKSKDFIESIRNIKSIRIDKLIRMHGFDQCGNTLSREYGKFFSGIDFDFKGLNKSVIDFLNTEGIHIIRRSIDRLSDYGISVKMMESEKVVPTSVKYMLTGSPKTFGFKTKAEFIKTLPEDWKQVGNIKDADILFTDSLDSNSSKMKNARNLNKEIKLYK